MTACSSLSGRTVDEYTILSATDPEAAGAVPARCRVLGVLLPELVVEVVLPAE